MSDEIFAQLTEKMQANPKLRSTIVTGLKEKGLLEDYKTFLSNLSQAEPDEVVEETPTEVTTETPKEVVEEAPKEMLRSPEVDVQTSAPETQAKITRTLENVGQVYPALETGAQMLTSAYGLPLSGLSGLAAALFVKADSFDERLRKMDEVRQKVYDLTVYQPKAQRSQELSQAAAYPFTKLSEGAEEVATPIAEAGYPGVATVVHTGIELLPELVGAKAVRSKVKKTMFDTKKADKKITKVIKEELPPVIKANAKTRKAYKPKIKADSKLVQGVKSIVERAEQLELKDAEGNKIKDPNSLESFQEAIDQSKQVVFDEFDALTQKADSAKRYTPVKYPLKKDETRPVVTRGGKAYFEEGYKVDTKSSVRELERLKKDLPLQTVSESTINYIDDTIRRFKDKEFTTSEAQQSIRMLNESTRAYQANPNMDTKGKAMVDSLVLNNLRKDIQKVVEDATGEEYAPLKKEYGALKSLEEDVAKSVNRKANEVKGLPSFSDVIAAHQIIKGLASGNVATVAAGLTVEGASMFRKFKRDPNKRVQKMFGEVRKQTEAINKENIRRANTPSNVLTKEIF